MMIIIIGNPISEGFLDTKLSRLRRGDFRYNKQMMGFPGGGGSRAEVAIPR